MRGYVDCEKNSGSSYLHRLKGNEKPLRVKAETDSIYFLKSFLGRVGGGGWQWWTLRLSFHVVDDAVVLSGGNSAFIFHWENRYPYL